MKSIPWDSLIVGGIVLAATLWLLRSFLKKKKPGCGSCDGDCKENSDKPS